MHADSISWNNELVLPITEVIEWLLAITLVRALCSKGYSEAAQACAEIINAQQSICFVSVLLSLRNS